HLCLIQKPLLNGLFQQCYLSSWTAANHAKTVLQSPNDLMKNQNESAVIICSHKIQDYNRMLWYKQSQDMSGLKFMGYLFTNENIEPEFINKIQMQGDAKKNATLTINNLTPQDSAVYFCAAYYTVI
uniref:Ig-like domain-containing protein n=1 Tax=Cyprinus carpio TaxID=7962 RepID=A0A8C2AY44_CYPCA